MRFFILLLTFAAMNFAPAMAEEADPIPKLLHQLKSKNVEIREKAFYELMDVGASNVSSEIIKSNVPVGIPQGVQALLKTYPAEADKIKIALIAQLKTENASPVGKEEPSESEGETEYGEYYANLITAVVGVNDVRSLPLLTPLLNSGNMVIERVVSFGHVALDSIIFTTYDPAPEVRDGASFALLKMLSPEYSKLFSDHTSLSKIRAGLVRLKSLETIDFMQREIQSGLQKLPPVIAGDLDADGFVNCADLTIIKASFGKKVGQAGFDIRADVNGDGVVDKKDLNAEAKLVPAGTVCK